MAPFHHITPLIYLGICLGLLFSGILQFSFLFFHTRDRLHLAVLLFGLSGLLFVGGEIAVIGSSLAENILLGRQFHRLQALSVVFFIFAIPYILNYMAELTPLWKRINRGMIMAGLLFTLCTIILSFLLPELFISQRSGLVSPLNISWQSVRGKPGLLYFARDIYATLSMVYLVISLTLDVFLKRRYRYLLIPLTGVLVTVMTAIIDYLMIYQGSGEPLLPRLGSSYFSIGITLLVLSFMISVMRRYIDGNREVEKARKIESLALFAGGIAHDFNNLLMAIVGNLSLARLNLDQNDGINPLLDDAERAATRAQSLTRQLQSFTRHGVTNPDVTGLQDLITETAGFLLRGSNIKTSYSIDADLFPVKIDRDQMGQVIQNIVINARDAMPAGGVLTIEAQNSPIGPGGAQRPFVRISITDEGTGIPRRDLDRIFDPYFTTKERGNGLGLTISYSIVRQYGGHITVRSREGFGTTFEILLPGAEAPATRKEEAPVHPKTFSGSVLVMDDEAMVRETLSRMLESLGFNVITAANGEEAVDLYKERISRGQAFQFVVLDLTVPGGMGGAEVMEILRSVDPGVRAVVSSGYCNSPVMNRFREYGFSGRLSKPFRVQELRKLLTELME